MIKYKLMCKKNLFCLELVAAASINWTRSMMSVIGQFFLLLILLLLITIFHIDSTLGKKHSIHYATTKMFSKTTQEEGKVQRKCYGAIEQIITLIL